jgi:hypothetical protein
VLCAQWDSALVLAAATLLPRKQPQQGDFQMSFNTILLIVLVVVLIGGGGFYFGL